MTVRRRQRGAEPVERDQAPSEFTQILGALCRDTFALGAALVDQEGESVDYAGQIDAFDIKVAGAEWRLILQFLQHSQVEAWRNTNHLTVRARDRSYAAMALGEGYAVVMELPHRCFTLSTRALAHAARRLSEEAGLSFPEWAAGPEIWEPVQVRASTGTTMRPHALRREDGWCGLTVLGRYFDDDFREGDLGYRIRLSDGDEWNLVREPLGHWYRDAAL